MRQKREDQSWKTSFESKKKKTIVVLKERTCSFTDEDEEKNWKPVTHEEKVSVTKS